MNSSRYIPLVAAWIALAGVLTPAVATTTPAAAWKAHYQAARQAFRGGDLPRAEGHLRRCHQAAKQLPEHPAVAARTYAALGKLWEAQGHRERAHRALTKARRLRGMAPEREPTLEALPRPVAPAEDPRLASARRAFAAGEPGAIERLEALADDGLAPAARILGPAYLAGQGVPADPAMGVEYLRRAATERDGMALRLLAEMHGSGTHVRPDWGAARRLMEQAARVGDPRAAWIYSRMLAQGFGGPEAPEQVGIWLQAAVTAGVPEALEDWEDFMALEDGDRVLD